MKKIFPKCRGVALILVLILIAIASVLGLGYLGSTTIKLASSRNVSLAVLARYLAESGLQHGLYILRTNPDSLDGQAHLGPYHLDNSSDSYIFYAVPDGQVNGKYVLTALGTSGGVTQSSSATIYVTGGPEVSLSRGMLVSGLARLPSSVTLNGDFHSNGLLINYGHINGDASATSVVWDPYSRITGQKTSFAPEVDSPDLEWNDYKDYSLFGSKYDGVTCKDKTFTSSNPLNNGGAITSGNIGGVVQLKPTGNKTATITANVDFQGTIIVEGDLILDGTNINLTAVEGFPALIVSGKIKLVNGANLTINGLVIAEDGITRYGSQSSNTQTTINGGLVSDVGGYDENLGGTHVINYEASRCKIYDFNTQGQQLLPTAEILQWND